jgi:hypothetical protein
LYYSLDCTFYNLNLICSSYTDDIVYLTIIDEGNIIVID